MNSSLSLIPLFSLVADHLGAGLVLVAAGAYVLHELRLFVRDLAYACVVLVRGHGPCCCGRDCDHDRDPVVTRGYDRSH